MPGLTSPLAESPGETLLRLRLRRMGLQVAEQVVVGVGPGAPRVDFLVNASPVVEFDGRVKYGLAADPEQALGRRSDGMTASSNSGTT